jgi:AcrR family transcriptional regulator
VGRIAGVTAEDTRKRLLSTAAAVFGRLGYDGASIAQITAESGLSSGAIYAHYASKAELFVATLRAHAEDGFERALGGDVADFLRARGEALDDRAGPAALLVEAVVAAKRDPEVAAVLRRSMARREGQLAEVLRAAQAIGEVDPSLPPRAVVRFALMLALGSLLIGALDLPPVPHDDWAATVSRVVDLLRKDPAWATTTP